MANTATIAALQAQLWTKQLYADVPKFMYFSKFIDRSGITEFGLRRETSPNAIIQEITDLSKNPGDTINFGLSIKLSGNGVDGDSELEGNEEAITTYQESLTINQKRNAVRLTGKMDEKKVAYNMRTDAKDKLAIWLAEITQEDLFLKLCGDSAGNGNSNLYNFANTPSAPASSRRVYANGRTAEGDLVAADVFDTKCIDAAKQTAQLASPKIRPVNVNGKDYYVIIVHPYQATDLRKDPVWNQAQRDANIRGENNPIFSGALGVFNQCVIHEHENIVDWGGGSGGANIARAVLCGQQAGIIAYGAPSEWVEKTFDYKNKWGIACGRIWGCLKPMFNSVDYGVITISTAATTASTS